MIVVCDCGVWYMLNAHAIASLCVSMLTIECCIIIIAT